MSMVQLLLVVNALVDTDNTLQRIQKALENNLELLKSFTNEQAIISDHQRLSHLYDRLQAIKNNVDFLIYDAQN